MSSILLEFYKGSTARIKFHKESVPAAFGTMVWRNKRRYGGYVVHIGRGLDFCRNCGVSGLRNSYPETHGNWDTLEIRGYTMKYEKLVAVEATSVKTRGDSATGRRAGRKIDLDGAARKGILQGPESAGFRGGCAFHD